MNLCMGQYFMTLLIIINATAGHLLLRRLQSYILGNRVNDHIYDHLESLSLSVEQIVNCGAIITLLCE